MARVSAAQLIAEQQTDDAPSAAGPAETPAPRRRARRTTKTAADQPAASGAAQAVQDSGTEPAGKVAAAPAPARRRKPAAKRSAPATTTTDAPAPAPKKQQTATKRAPTPATTDPDEPEGTPSESRITLPLQQVLWRGLALARVEDGIETTVRLRAMVELWEHDPRLRARIDRLAAQRMGSLHRGRPRKAVK